MTSCVIEKRQLLRKFAVKTRTRELEVDDFFISTPKINLTTLLKQVPHSSVARPIISSLEFETNPIIQIQPKTGKHYPMVVVKRSVASFKPTATRIIKEDR